MTPLISRFSVTLFTLALLGCGSGVSSDLDGPKGFEPSRDGVRCDKDIDALQSVKASPLACEDTTQCPVGSHCSEGVCTWECFADSDCGSGSRCDCAGSCHEGTVRSAMNSDACQRLPEAEKQSALTALGTDPVSCYGDDDCPCGASCDDAGTCIVDPTLAADALPAMTVTLLPNVVSADTSTGAVVRAVTVQVATHNLDQVTASDLPVLQLGFASTSGNAPRVRCSAGDAFASDCSLDASWSLAPADQRLVSAPAHRLDRAPSEQRRRPVDARGQGPPGTRRRHLGRPCDPRQRRAPRRVRRVHWQASPSAPATCP